MVDNSKSRLKKRNRKTFMLGSGTRGTFKRSPNNRPYNRRNKPLLLSGSTKKSGKKRGRPRGSKTDIWGNIEKSVDSQSRYELSKINLTFSKDKGGP